MAEEGWGHQQQGFIEVRISSASKGEMTPAKKRWNLALLQGPSFTEIWESFLEMGVPEFDGAVGLSQHYAQSNIQLCYHCYTTDRAEITKIKSTS